MGIGYINGTLLIRENASRPFSGRVLQLGRQHIAEVPGYCGSRDDGAFFGWLGFREVHSCDVSAYERPTFVMDLNDGRMTAAWKAYHDGYDTIYDGGTLEHVFHLPNALANIHDLLAPGGRIIHANPCSGYLDHGFYSFSPTFYYDYYTANGYRIDACTLALTRTDEADRPRFLEYEPDKWGSLTGDRGFAGAAWNDGADIWDVFFVATKLERSTCGVVPTQRVFKRLWCER
jgi:SAM-dependent methyltransferase